MDDRDGDTSLGELAQLGDDARNRRPAQSGPPPAAARRAVLKEALAAYAQRGGRALKGFLGYLSTLPEGVSRLASGEKLAADIAQTLLAARP